MRHLISPLDFTVEETYEVLDFADRIAANPKAYAHAADGRQLATLFYEPSTRTRLSFESAMLSLGGQTIGFAGADQSSVSKGETIADTVRVVSCYEISLSCAIRRKGHRFVRPCIRKSRSLMPGMADIITQHRL